MTNTMIIRRMTELNAMHEAMCNYGGDEAYYMWWIMIVPDEPTVEDFMYIAKDDKSFLEVIDLWQRICDAVRKEDGDCKELEEGLKKYYGFKI